MKGRAIVTLALFVLINPAVSLRAQEPAPPPQPDGQILPPQQLDSLLGPIALYPDPLISEILPAAAQASQIVLADNYIQGGGDPNAIDQQPWDDSIKALAHYPDVLHYLDSNLQWTVAIGQAYLNQPDDVMNSIQHLRSEALEEGNLQPSPQQDVESDDGEIEIVPTNPDSIYVPSYDPGIIYYQPGCAITFGVGFPIGIWLRHDFDWRHHRMFVWDHDHPRPGNWWHRPIADRRQFIARNPVYHPPPRAVSRGPVVQARQYDRGYVNRDVHRVGPAHVEAPHAPAHEQRPAPNPVQVHTIPARPTVSAFMNVQNAPAARAASVRGAESRQSVSIVRPSGGGGGHPAASGGGGGHPTGGGGGGGGGGRKK